MVLFEGWMLGFEPQEEFVVTAVDPRYVSILLYLQVAVEANDFQVEVIWELFPNCGLMFQCWCSLLP